MAVPKRKTSKSKRNHRRAHHALSKVNVMQNKNSGDCVLPHHINLSDGTYKGKSVVKMSSRAE
ncbi:50S ribosomal protein L32 [Candidatus Sneabacter namystus]|uniref:Large ribosomal subunit protein bL32 n=1 Tax=Candidatus Sneabacter namystus TaxID=2601646 RepID=A0A5C0UHN0_9RICK|nr:50S ribosomal protein L32 [Candidatus Sneabacter namystus]QEK39526.1 50S ribosomal protein L32 [Candidatus Sneabacter namystus]